MLEDWLRGYYPEALFDDHGRLAPELAALAPFGDQRLGANPHRNGGILLVDLTLPDFRDLAVDVVRPAVQDEESTRRLGRWLRDIYVSKRRQTNFKERATGVDARRRDGDDALVR